MKTRYICRKAEQTDIDALTELFCELFGDDRREELFSEYTTLLQDARQVFFLAFDGDAPIGACHCALRDEYVNGREYDGTLGYLEAIYVRPPYRKQGAASALVALCEEWARSMGCREFLSDCLLDNTDSYKFHLKLGFAETERCIFFRKNL